MNDRLLPTICFSVFLISTIFELLRDSPLLEKEIPETKMALPTMNVPTITIQYCHSCGYQKAYTEYAQILKEKYPELIVKGEYYEPAGLFNFFAKFLNFARMALIICVLLEKDVFQMLGHRSPRWFTWCTNNKLYSCLTIFFFSNMVENMLISSGAFEISMNGMPLWSKIDSGRIPQPKELFRIIDNHLNLKHTLDFDSNTQFPK